MQFVLTHIRVNRKSIAEESFHASILSLSIRFHERRDMFSVYMYGFYDNIVNATKNGLEKLIC